ncbi:hypothetical protein PIB30_004045 [Stylosanthes scabra]|uniref:Uncharacterized protein n=1 Tax=Stylosanthes scabra TaxID=79078 RepID=A0ABU6Y296_9FABA|nr:hypothetical protein [Stylosanthes scabra]
MRVQIWGLPKHCKTTTLEKKIVVTLGRVANCEIFETTRDLTELGMGLSLKAFSLALSPFRKGVTCPRSNELSPRRNTPPRVSGAHMVGVCNQELEVERTRWNLLSPGPQLMHLGTKLNPCRRALTLAGRGVYE